MMTVWAKKRKKHPRSPKPHILLLPELPGDVGMALGGRAMGDGGAPAAPGGGLGRWVTPSDPMVGDQNPLGLHIPV